MCVVIRDGLNSVCPCWCLSRVEGQYVKVCVKFMSICASVGVCVIIAVCSYVVCVCVDACASIGVGVGVLYIVFGVC